MQLYGVAIIQYTVAGGNKDTQNFVLNSVMWVLIAITVHRGIVSSLAFRKYMVYSAYHQIVNVFRFFGKCQLKFLVENFPKNRKT